MTDGRLKELRSELETVNADLLALFARRGELVAAVRRVKEETGAPLFDPKREERMLKELVARNPGPYPDATVRHLFHEIFRASLDLMERGRERALRVSRDRRPDDFVIRFRGTTVGEVTIGDGVPTVIAGPCAIESEEQLDQAAAAVAAAGLRFLRGGAFKPRTSPYAFQGLGVEGLRILRDACRRHGLLGVTEVMDPRAVGVVAEHADILQIGARNMSNFDLLREVGQARCPVLIKRGLSATVDEFLSAAEYVVTAGNENVILCERGIRTYETATRNTLDISAIPILRQRTWLPVLVDVSHAAGRKDILAALTRASLAAGAHGVMVEVHPTPHTARSDAEQQLSLDEFRTFLAETGLAVDEKTRRAG